jgi:predicted dehydrogenase
MPRHTRRSFLGRTATILAAPYVVTPSALGGNGRPAPSGRITMGLIGCGGMGRANMRSFLDKPEVEMLAVCDPDRARLQETIREVSGRRSAACTGYKDFRELLARDDIDAVIVGSPDHWHALHAIHAARAGKDIYGEKPLSHTIGQGRSMADAVDRLARVFQTGSQQRSDRRFRHACELVRNGRIGTVRTVEVGIPGGSTIEPQPEQPIPDGFDYDLWLGPAPWAPYTEKRCHYNFRHNLDYSGGKLTDWGAHHIDIAQWGLGMTHSGPVMIKGKGEYPRDGLWNAALNFDYTATYETGAEVRICNRLPQGVKFNGDDGWVFVRRGSIDAHPKSLLDEEFGPGEIRLYRSDDHRRNFLDCVRSRRETAAPVEQAHRSITVAHLGNIAMLLGRAIRWNPAQESITGDPGARRMLDRAVREPWNLI